MTPSYKLMGGIAIIVVLVVDLRKEFKGNHSSPLLPRLLPRLSSDTSRTCKA
jgi:hypothetical protein